MGITLNIFSGHLGWMFVYLYECSSAMVLMDLKECGSHIRFLKWTWRPHEKYGWHPPAPVYKMGVSPPDMGENWKGDKIWEFFPAKWILERHVFLIGKRAEQHPEELLGWVRTGCQGGSRVGIGFDSGPAETNFSLSLGFKLHTFWMFSYVYTAYIYICTSTFQGVPNKP